ncbi:MAG: type II toxin-antitoxin system VapC family toxin [Kiritimatiellia bacterium]
MSVYWDTSCLLKLYCRESDSEKYLKLMENSTEPLYTSSLTVTELYFALLQKELRSETGSEKAKEIYRDFETDLSQGLLLQIPLEKKHYMQTR